MDKCIICYKKGKTSSSCDPTAMGKIKGAKHQEYLTQREEIAKSLCKLLTSTYPVSVNSSFSDGSQSATCSSSIPGFDESVVNVFRDAPYCTQCFTKVREVHIWFVKLEQIQETLGRAKQLIENDIFQSYLHHALISSGDNCNLLGTSVPAKSCLETSSKNIGVDRVRRKLIEKLQADGKVVSTSERIGNSETRRLRLATNYCETNTSESEIFPIIPVPENIRPAWPRKKMVARDFEDESESSVFASDAESDMVFYPLFGENQSESEDDLGQSQHERAKSKGTRRRGSLICKSFDSDTKSSSASSVSTQPVEIPMAYKNSLSASLSKLQSDAKRHKRKKPILKDLRVTMERLSEEDLQKQTDEVDAEESRNHRTECIEINKVVKDCHNVKNVHEAKL